VRIPHASGCPGPFKTSLWVAAENAVGLALLPDLWHWELDYGEGPRGLCWMCVKPGFLWVPFGPLTRQTTHCPIPLFDQARSQVKPGGLNCLLSQSPFCGGRGDSLHVPRGPESSRLQILITDTVFAELSRPRCDM